MIENAIKQIVDGQNLSRDEAATAMGVIMDGSATPAQIAAFLVAMRIKGETVEEITGAATAMRSRMNRVSVTRRPVVDTCGTGGDNAGTFNVSTAVAFVLAAAGATVAKHGNRAVSSKSGSADVFAELGTKIDAPLGVAEKCINEIGLGFLFAPLVHPAMKHAAPVRRELGLRTLFNIVGPLTNPAQAPFQLLGVYDKKWIGPLAEVLGQLGSQRAWVVHGHDGLDEISVCASTSVAEWTGTTVRYFEIKPADLGIKLARPADLRGGDAKQNAHILRSILSGESSRAPSDIVALNAAAGLTICGLSSDLMDGIKKARAILEKRLAEPLIEKLATLSQHSL